MRQHTVALYSYVSKKRPNLPLRLWIKNEALDHWHTQIHSLYTYIAINNSLTVSVTYGSIS